MKMTKKRRIMLEGKETLLQKIVRESKQQLLEKAGDTEKCLSFDMQDVQELEKEMRAVFGD